jgi:hypothetical protein
MNMMVTTASLERRPNKVACLAEGGVVLWLPKARFAPRVAPYAGKPATVETATGCLYPVDEQGGEHLFCNQPITGRRSYCAAHGGIATRSAPQDGRGLERLAASIEARDGVLIRPEPRG